MLRFFAAFGEPIRIDGFPQANIRDVWPLIQRQTVAIELNAVQATEHEVQFAFLSHCALKTPLPTTGLMTVRRRGFAWKIVAIEPRG